jgi:XrtJ-associated TM-motif-TM protein
MRTNGRALFLLIAVVLFVLTSRSAFAQISGCVDSPEDPTVVMALLGFGAAGANVVWSRIRSRRNSK